MKYLPNAPAPLAVDFMPPPRRPGRAAWLTLAAGLAVAAAVAVHLQLQRSELAERRAGLVALRLQAPAGIARPAAASDDPVQIQAIVARLGADWGGLLAVLAQALEPGIRVLEVQGDAERGTVRIVAEAPSLDAAFAYVERLQGKPGLRGFALDSHAWPQGANVGALTFTASGRWGVVP